MRGLNSLKLCKVMRTADLNNLLIFTREFRKIIVNVSRYHTNKCTLFIIFATIMNVKLMYVYYDKHINTPRAISLDVLPAKRRKKKHFH